MGRTLVELVSETLERTGIRVGRAYPGARMPMLTGMVAAVQLGQLDQANGTGTVLVSVMVPSVMGAAACEDGGLGICQTLRAAGGVCRQEKSEYRKGADLFCTEIFAEFYGQETESGWEETSPPPNSPTFSVIVGDTMLSGAVSFEAHREIDEEVTALQSAVWHFSLEEVIALDAPETEPPLNAFSITIRRAGRTEVFSDCVMTAQVREIRQDGQHQIRKGTAGNRTVS